MATEKPNITAMSVIFGFSVAKGMLVGGKVVQVVRLTTSHKARAFVHDNCGDWLHQDSVEDSVKAHACCALSQRLAAAFQSCPIEQESCAMKQHAYLSLSIPGVLRLRMLHGSVICRPFVCIVSALMEWDLIATFMIFKEPVSSSL
jgi:hypothetical protein